MKHNILLIIILFLGIGLFGLYEFKTSKKIDNTNNFPNNSHNFPQPSTPPVVPAPAPAPAPAPTPTPTPIVTNPTSYTEALKIAEQTNKKIVLMFSADWCGWCKKFKTEVLTDASVQEALKNYVFFIVNADENRSIVSKFGVIGLPNFFVIDYNENRLKQKAGFMSSEEFISWVNSNLDKRIIDGIRRPIDRRP